MLSDLEIAKGCAQNKHSAQKELYERYVKKMNALCKRYISDRDEIKDILQESFIKAFENIQQFKGEGSLEGWVKKIMINTILTKMRKNKSSIFIRTDENDDEEKNLIDLEEDQESIFNAEFNKEDLMKMIEALPDNYRIIFNLYCLENYSHREISELLSIKENSSRTRLNRARKILQEQLLKIHHQRLSNQNL